MAGLRLIARSLFLTVVALSGVVHGVAIATEPKLKAGAAASCFPSAGFQMPSEVPKSTDGWWCDPTSEYAFMGFSYEVTACQSRAQLQREFADIKNSFQGRYVRLYGACDRKGFYDDIVDAAWDNGLGVHALIWFGFDYDDIWITRRDTLLAALHANPKAKFVTRVLQFGSEPLFDWVLTPNQLATQILAAKKNLSSLGIPVTISELAYGYQEHDNAPMVMDAIDLVDIHMLPFFAQDASTSDKAWPIVQRDLNWFIAHGQGKKMYFSQNGWPSTTYPGVEPNSPDAVADIPNEQGYYALLDAHCQDFKTAPNGGVGWFWHIYSDNQEPGYGLYTTRGQLKFPFAPKTHC
ncbi:glycoside hydrolase superfamily [Earliella scabrosa]|nr:glycoside hydrolase superfamily [Earliella scabrosa]